MPASSQDQEIIAWLQQKYEQRLNYGYNKGRVVFLSARSSPTVKAPPPELPKMPSGGQRLFVSLSISGSRVRLPGFPEEICQLTALESLELRDHSFARLPAEIGQLSHLETLELTDSELEELPPEIGQLTNLTQLSLSGNRLRNLPAEIGRLTNLTQLSLNGNQLRSLPAEIGRLTSLYTLELNHNQLTEVPAEIGHLSRLTRLPLEENLLTHLPAEIGQLHALDILDLSGNRLTELPAEIGQLRQLSILQLKDNRLGHLPTEIGQLSHLEFLELENNQLTELPTEITNLKQLHPLNLDGNPIGELPPEQRHLLGITFEVEEYGGPQPLRVLYDEVFVEYALFALIDEKGSNGSFDEKLPGWVQANPDIVYFNGENIYHYAWVRLEAWEREAPPVRGTWDETSEVSFTSTSGHVCLCDVMGGEVSRHVLTLGPAGQAYHLRAFRWIQPEKEDDDWEEEQPEKENDDWEEDSSLPRGIERYLLQFWPA